MSSNRYIEFNSSFRNRNIWPLAGQFEVPISQTGQKSQYDALDPVCLSSPAFVWTCNNFDMNGGPIISGNFNTLSSVTPITYSPKSFAGTDPYTIIIKAPLNSLQQIRDYYTGTVINIPIETQDVDISLIIPQRRILEYVYLFSTNSGIGGITGDFAQISVSGALIGAVPPLTGNGRFTINDPSQISPVTTVPPPLPSFNLPQCVFFIPNGRFQRNAYNNSILYNETKREYRKITTYEGQDTRFLSINNEGLKTFKSGDINNWGLTDNYCIRKEPPFLPKLGEPYTPFAGSATREYTNIDPITGIPTIYTKIYSSSSSIIIFQGSNIPYGYNENYFKNCGVRILANPFAKTITDRLYNYYLYPPFSKTSYPVTITNLIPPLNEQRIIASSINFIDKITNLNTLVLEVYPPFTVDPYDSSSEKYVGEILFFSYDNFNPFQYSGSLVSQQDMVCYEIELINLIVPNETLKVALGGLPAFYPYLYVELSNISSSGGGIRNTIYSNVPYASKATFRVPIDDIPQPEVATFIKIDGDGMVQTIKFKPNDNLFFSLYFYDGEVYTTITKERYSPLPPEPFIQISCLFSFRRL